MSTSAVVIDTRVEGKGFFMQCDSFPTELGIELATIYTTNKAIEDLYIQWLDYTIREYVTFHLKMNGRVDRKAVEGYIREGVYFLSSDDVNSVRFDNYKGTNVGASHVFVLKDDGVYVKSDNDPSLMKIG